MKKRSRLALRRGVVGVVVAGMVGAGLTVVAGAGVASATVGPQAPSRVGYFDLSDRLFHLTNSSATTPSTNHWVDGPAGTHGSLPVIGDWDGDGRDSTGYYSTSDHLFHLKNSLAAGGGSDYLIGGVANSGNMIRPVAGDWDGDGRDGVGYLNATEGKFYLKNSLTTGTWNYTTTGPVGDFFTPVAGDWNGDGKDTIGWFDRRDASFHLRDSLTVTQSTYIFTMGIGSATAQGSYSRPVVGDWDGDGKDSTGYLDAGYNDTYFHLKNALTSAGGSNYIINYGPGGANTIPVAGNWSVATTSGDVTLADLKNIYGSVSDEARVAAGLPSLNAAMRAAQINTPARKAAFLATLRNESAFFFDALQSGTSSYRGRGFIQLTSSANYSSAGSYLGVDLINNPEQARSIQWSGQIAAWYWTVARQINPLADDLDMGGVDAAIGYAPNAAEDAERCDDFKAALRYFNNNVLPGGIDCVR